MTRKLHLLIILILLTFPLFLGGCWDMRPMKEQGIVAGVGIDKIKGNDPILLSLQVIDLSALKGGSGGMGSGEKGAPSKKTVIVETSRGKSLYDAIHNFLAFSSRHITFAHNHVVILGNDLARSDISSVMDDMYRNYQFRMTNWMFVAEKNAKEVLESRTDIGSIPATEMNLMMLHLSKNAFINPVNRNEFVYHLTNEGKGSFMPFVQIEQPGLNPTPRIKIEKTAVFSGNRLVDILTVDESQSLVWLHHGQKGGTVKFPFKSGKSKKAKWVSIEVWDGKTKIIPRISKDELVMEIFCTGRGTLRESENIRTDSKSFATLGKTTAHVLKKRLLKTVQKAQRINVDFLSFAEIIHQQNPQAWRRLQSEWKQTFPQIRARIHFKINIEQFGINKDSVLLKTERGD